MLEQLAVPIVQAPLAGGPSTPALAAAVSEAGGLGFVAAGYKTPEAMAEDVVATRALTGRPFGVNLFVPSPGPADPQVVERYAAALRPEAERAGVELGKPRFDDDGFEAKLAILQEDPVAAVSFTFGCPSAETISSLKAVGSEVWATVTDVEEARQAEAAGATALILQGTEAGGHKGSFVDRPDATDFSILVLLQLIGAQTKLPLIAAGGLETGGAIAAVLAAGASAAQLGTAFMRCPEAATSAPHRQALASSSPTALTRAFTGRLARGIVNRFMREHEAEAPIAYPEIHYLTAPLRAHGRQSGDADLINLWAGQTHALAQELPAAELVARLHQEALKALDAAQARLAQRPAPHGSAVAGPSGRTGQG